MEARERLQSEKVPLVNSLSVVSAMVAMIRPEQCTLVAETGLLQCSSCGAALENYMETAMSAESTFCLHGVGVCV